MRRDATDEWYMTKQGLERESCITTKLLPPSAKAARSFLRAGTPFRSDESTEDLFLRGWFLATSTDLDFVCRAAREVYESLPARQRR